MYGELLKPNRAGFFFEASCTDDDYEGDYFDDYNGTENSFSIFVRDLDDKSNDGVRDVDHPDFDKYWGNECENMFGPFNKDEIEEGFEPLNTKTKAREWLISIGMIELKN